MADADGDTRVRVCVVDSPELGPAYPRLDESDLEPMALVPGLEHVNMSLLHEYDVVVVGCSGAELESAAFQSQILRIVRVAPALAVVDATAAPATAARLGFHGLVSRDVGPEAFSRTARAVASGEIAFPRSAVAALFQLLSFLPLPVTNPDAPVPLTARQQQIVDLIAQGATDREIATRLQISESTAHKHVQNALRRSKAKTRSQLVAVARQPVAT